VTKLGPVFGQTNDAETAILFRALAINRGLVDLDLESRAISDDNWSVLCESMKAHPNLTNLNLRTTSPIRPTDGRIVLTDNGKAHRTRLLAGMMQENTSMHTIQLSKEGRVEQIYTQMICPYLETNLYRPRVLAITKADLSLRRAFLGRALQTATIRNDSNLLWMFLSGNAYVVV
jgi:hypothetical protein